VTVNSGAIRAADEIGNTSSSKGSLVGTSNVGVTMATITARGLRRHSSADIEERPRHQEPHHRRPRRVCADSRRLDTSATPAAVNGNASIGPVKVGADLVRQQPRGGVQDDSDPELDDGFGDTTTT
jgi:hypothetical protein